MAVGDYGGVALMTIMMLRRLAKLVDDGAAADDDDYDDAYADADGGANYVTMAEVVMHNTASSLDLPKCCMPAHGSAAWLRAQLRR